MASRRVMSSRVVFLYALVMTSFYQSSWSSLAVRSTKANQCYNVYSRPQLCRPEFHDLAYEKNIQVSYTCGEIPRRFCRPTIHGRVCDICDNRDPRRTHPAKYLTDVHNENNVTSWMADPVQSRDNITFILSLGKTYDITYISLQFRSIRPESMAMYKSDDFGKTWQPYQFYSSDCEGMYRRRMNGQLKENDQEALCTNGHLIRPHHGGRIAFSTMAGRVNSPQINEYSPDLNQWVMATDIKVEFNRISSTSRRPKDTQYYAVSSFMVGGRCHCNGHANKCMINRDGQTVCDCRHNTAGPDCQVCKPFFNDRPWRRASTNSANVCRGKKYISLLYIFSFSFRCEYFLKNGNE